MPGRNQHTIPEFYLRPFLSPGLVYRRGQPSPLSVKNPRHVAAHHDYYGKASELDDLNTKVEGLCAPAFKKLMSKDMDITTSDWENLSFLLANFAIRNPANIDEWRDAQLKVIEEINEILSPQIDGLPSETEIDTTQLEEINKSRDRLLLPGGYREAIPIVAFREVASCIRQMEFVLADAPEGSEFVTTDRPLTLRRIPTGSRVGAGWANRDALGQIALSPSRFLIMLYGNPGRMSGLQVTPEQVEEWNEETILFADQEIYSASESAEAMAWMSS